MATDVTVALVGEPVPIGSAPYSAEDLEVPWDQRDAVSFPVEPDDLLGEILARAADEFGLSAAWAPEDQDQWPGATLAEAFAWVSLYRPEHDHGTPVRPLTALTLADSEGRAVWNNYFKDVTHGEMLWAAEVGALEGDPRRIYLFTWGGFGNGLIADLTTLVNLWDLAWYVLERIGASYAAFEALRRVTRKLRRGRNVTEERKGDWQRRGGNPGTLSEFLHHRPSTTNEVSGLLGCSDDEVEAVLWAFGFAPDDEGLWRVAGDDDAKMLRAIWELIEYGYNRVELERRFRELGEAYAETAEGPIIDWDEELRQPDSQ